MGHRVNSARVCRPRTTGQLSPEFTRPLVDLRFGYSLGYLSGQGCPLNAEMQIAQKSQKNLSTRLGNEMWEVVGLPHLIPLELLLFSISGLLFSRLVAETLGMNRWASQGHTTRWLAKCLSLFFLAVDKLTSQRD